VPDRDGAAPHHVLSQGQLTATIAQYGAELSSLRANDHEFLWQARPIWPRHAPLLFPVIGRLVHDQLRIDGRTYPMTQHGFARDMDFAWIERTKSTCHLSLTDSEATRAHYPYAFALDARYTLRDGQLHADFTISNPADTILPASFGLHPAFNWPLFDAIPREDHTLIFAAEEPAPIRQLQAGLLLPNPIPSTIKGRRLALAPELFAHDALILDRPASRSAKLAVPDGRGITIAWEGVTCLGIWSKPADFLCIEPWHGHADPVGFEGDFTTKPGLMLIPPGATRRLAVTITPQPMQVDEAARRMAKPQGQPSRASQNGKLP
jgi:galactose mutarotase-like enzyme